MIDPAAVAVAVTLTIIAAFALACAIVGCPPRRRDPNDSPITMVSRQHHPCPTQPNGAGLTECTA